MISAVRRLVKGALWDAKGTLSLSRCVLLFVVLEVTAITWLAVLWCYYVTVNGLMVEAAPLASAVSGGAAAVLSSQVAAAAWQYFAQAKFTGGGVAGRQIDQDEARTAIVAGEQPAYIPDVAEFVPSDPNEPRIAAESQSTETVALKTDEPLDVAIVESPTSEPQEK